LDKNKIILNYCPNFYRIVNFDYFEDDSVTEKLIHIYEDYIFKIDISNHDDIDTVKTIDYVLGKYIDDYLFRRQMQKEIYNVKIRKSCTDVLKAVVESIIAIFDRYQEETTRKIYISRWI
jgi:hypothetical protein